MNDTQIITFQMPNGAVYNLPLDAAYRLSEMIAKGEVDISKEYQKILQKESIQFEYAKAIIDYKEKVHRDRDAISYLVCLDGKGRLQRETIGVDGKRMSSKVFCDAPSITTKHVIGEDSSQSCECFVVYSEGNALFALVGEMDDAETMRKAFARTGYAFCAHRDYKNYLYELTWEYLHKIATTERLPLYGGWNKLPNGDWVYAQEQESWKSYVLGLGGNRVYEQC